MAEKLKTMVIVAAVNCNKFNEFCYREDVKKSPTILVYTSKLEDSPKKVSAFKMANQLIAEISQKMESNVKQVDSNNWQQIVEHSRADKKHIFLTVSKRTTISPLIKSLSTVFSKITFLDLRRQYYHGSSEAQ